LLLDRPVQASGLRSAGPGSLEHPDGSRLGRGRVRIGRPPRLAHGGIRSAARPRTIDGGGAAITPRSERAGAGREENSAPGAGSYRSVSVFEWSDSRRAGRSGPQPGRAPSRKGPVAWNFRRARVGGALAAGALDSTPQNLR